MSVTLLVIQGPYAGWQIQAGAGQVFRVGRTDRSEHAFPNDTYLSGAHFEFTCDEQGCRIRDLGSSNGTFVNGAKIELAAVQEGDQIAAGETIFLVQPADPEQATAPPAPEMTPPEATQLPPVERTARMYAPGFEPEPQEESAPLTDERKRALCILFARSLGAIKVFINGFDVAAQPVFERRSRSQIDAVISQVVCYVGGIALGLQGLQR